MLLMLYLWRFESLVSLSVCQSVCLSIAFIIMVREVWRQGRFLCIYFCIYVYIIYVTCIRTPIYIHRHHLHTSFNISININIKSSIKSSTSTSHIVEHFQLFLTCPYPCPHPIYRFSAPLLLQSCNLLVFLIILLLKHPPAMQLYM
jgi:hypothetical protein